MGILHKTFLNNQNVLACNQCRTHLSTQDEILSRAFHGSSGRAYLMNSVVNYHEGPAVDKEMATGRHTVHDIYCNVCDSLLGWRYERAYDSSQQYKVNKFVLEVAHIQSITDLCNNGALSQSDQVPAELMHDIGSDGWENDMNSANNGILRFSSNTGNSSDDDWNSIVRNNRRRITPPQSLSIQSLLTFNGIPSAEMR